MNEPYCLFMSNKKNKKNSQQNKIYIYFYNINEHLPYPKPIRLSKTKQNKIYIEPKTSSSIQKKQIKYDLYQVAFFADYDLPKFWVGELDRKNICG